jgi:phasin family protein
MSAKITAQTPATAAKARRPAKKPVTKPAADAAVAQTAVLPADAPIPAAEGQAVVADVAPVAERIADVTPTTAIKKESIMATAFETTQETVRTATETAMNNGKAAMEQVTAKSKEAVETSMKTLEELTAVSRGNIEALIASAKVAASGMEQVMSHLTEVSKKSFEDTTAHVKSLTSAKNPTELVQLQTEFAKARWDVAVAEYSKLTETLVKLAGEVAEPMQNQFAVVTDKLKASFTAK